MYTGKSKCLKCGHVFEDESIFDGCPFCKTNSFASNITPIYELPKTNGTKQEYNNIFSGKGIEKYLPVLPFRNCTNLISLNEGNTPLTYLNSISNELNIKLYVKDETRNPTWGHKDRLNVILINKALEKKAPGVIYASTGNNGASGAAYAAKADLPCIVLTVKGVNKTMETFMQAYGACVVGVKTISDRWNILKECVDKFGWYPATNYTVPIVGSNPWAIEGYKIIAYELFSEMEELPDKIVVPICYGDALFGINKGFEELMEMGFIKKMPQMVSVEDYGPICNAVKKNSEIINPVEGWGSIASSMSTTYGTYHSLYTVRNYNGLTIAMDNNEQISSAQLELAQKEGVYCESASATTLVGVKKLFASGKIKKGEKVVMLITASGVKDTANTSKYVGEVPECEANIEEFSNLLQKKYDISL